MRAAVVYESIFGNTHDVAEAIGKGIAMADPGAEVVVLPVTEAAAEAIAGVDLLVVGGPTHIRGMTRDRSRAAAIAGAKEHGQQQTLDPSAEGPGLRDWFEGIPRVTSGRAAAFDTRADIRGAGGAAKGIARRLRRHGYGLVADPEGFYVVDSEGPLADGELDRATEWAENLVR